MCGMDTVMFALNFIQHIHKTE